MVVPPEWGGGGDGSERMVAFVGRIPLPATNLEMRKLSCKKKKKDWYTERNCYVCP